jgi:sugar phosphate isomerase/epimerase
MQISSVSRRAFLAAAGALPFALKTSLGARAVPVGIELYSVRDQLTKDLTGTVRAVARLGYQTVEFYSPYFSWTPQQATEVRTLLDDLGIQCPSTHNGAQAFSGDGLQKAIELNRILGSRYLIMASPPRGTSGVDGWKRAADLLNASAETLKSAGMMSGYHNHQTEWRPVEGQRPMDILASNTSQDVVLQFDVGTCMEAGADPIAWINAHPGRTRSMHCKDWSPSAGYAVLFGEGVSPWAQIFAAAESVGGIEYYLIEQEEGPVEEQLLRAEQCLANWKEMRG